MLRRQDTDLNFRKLSVWKRINGEMQYHEKCLPRGQTTRVGESNDEDRMPFKK